MWLACMVLQSILYVLQYGYCLGHGKTVGHDTVMICKTLFLCHNIERLLGVCVVAYRLKKEILPPARQLCQDLNHEVRRAMAVEMYPLCLGLGYGNFKVLSEVHYCVCYGYDSWSLTSCLQPFAAASITMAVL